MRWLGADALFNIVGIRFSVGELNLGGDEAGEDCVPLRVPGCGGGKLGLAPVYEPNGIVGEEGCANVVSEEEKGIRGSGE